MPVTAAVVGIGAFTSYMGNRSQANAAKEATKTQTAAGNQALQVQKQMWEEQQRRQQPFVDVGTQALQRANTQSMQARTPMPMFNPQQRNGGWTPQNFAAQSNPFMGVNQQPSFNIDPNRYQQLYQQGGR